MFQIDENNLPIVRTRTALLALDLQNDFLALDSELLVNQPPDFVENLVELAVPFREAGNDVIWIRSIFQTSRPVNGTHRDSETIILDHEFPSSPQAGGARSGSTSASQKRYNEIIKAYSGNLEPADAQSVDDDGGEAEEAEEEEVAEDVSSDAFLTTKPGERPRVVSPSSPGANFSLRVLPDINSVTDIIFQKTHYSAFKDGTLVQILRAKFVTEIYICGSLTNVSVFATAMDAARHGYSITILENCLGYRSKSRHDEALSQLSEFTGCDIISSKDVLRSLQAKRSPTSGDSRRPRTNNVSLESLMASVKLSQNGSSSRPISVSTPVSGTLQTSDARLSSRNEGAKLHEVFTESGGKNRDRVKTKVKTRRRPSTSISRDTALNEEPGVPPKTEKGHHSQKYVASEKARDLNAMKSHKRADGVLLCEGDTTVINNLLDDELAEGIFERLRDEVLWQKMSHRGGDVPRLVAVQGDVAKDGSIPIYRHPADESPPLLPFSPLVSVIRDRVEKELGHSVNHALIQFYRGGTDYISEHSDKTLDILPNTFIANVSLGAERTMTFRTKKQPKGDSAMDGTEAIEPRRTCKAPLPHNSLCKVGLATNMRWLHAIRQDKRLATEKSEAELAYGGGRISLTFRMIGTFLDKGQQKIWGHGATSKSKGSAKAVVNGETPDAERLVEAFGRENRSSEFDWAEVYGAGFNVLHISNSPKLFLSGDAVADLRVKIMLAEYGISWTEGALSPSFTWKNESSAEKLPNLPVKFVDNDPSKSTVVGDIATMLYIDAVYGTKVGATRSQVDLARQFTRLQQADELAQKCRALDYSTDISEELELWETFADEAPFIAGPAISLVDYAVLPVLIELRSEWAGDSEFPSLEDYFSRMIERDGIREVIDS